MGLMANDSGGGGFDPIPPGTYMARCVTVCDLGLQPTGFGTKEKVYLGFEVSSVRVEWDDKEGVHHEGAAFIGSRYTLSIHPKSILGQHVVSWRGKDFTDEERAGFDVFKVLGTPCMISVVHTVKNTKTYANIASIMRVPKGTVVTAAESELVGYTATDPQWSGTLEKLPPWLKKLAEEGQRQQPVESDPTPPAAPPATGLNPPPPGPDDFDDDIPFAFVLPTLLGAALAAQEILPLASVI